MFRTAEEFRGNLIEGILPCFSVLTSIMRNEEYPNLFISDVGVIHKLLVSEVKCRLVPLEELFLDG